MRYLDTAPTGNGAIACNIGSSTYGYNDVFWKTDNYATAVPSLMPQTVPFHHGPISLSKDALYITGTNLFGGRPDQLYRMVDPFGAATVEAVPDTQAAGKWKVGVRVARKNRATETRIGVRLGSASSGGTNK